ncbi:MAG: class I SAM-dependent methyltransferase [Alphaproteobacteria bacterium]|nr:class I SAM-dependent methyltransferase [Alphaproteobacteria bacterium]
MNYLARNEEVLAIQKTIYDSMNPTRRWLHRTRRAWVMDAIRRHAKEDGRAIEIGPGSGVYLPHLLAHFAQVEAADIERQFLAEAERLAAGDKRLTTRIADITRDALPDEAYDLILCTEVIEHIADSAAALRRMARMLKPGGVLVLTTPHRWSLLEMTAWLAFKPGFIHLVRAIYGEAVFEMGHINLLTRAMLADQLREANLAPFEHEVMGLYLPLIAEFGGKRAQRFEEWLENRLRNTSLRQLLWTQAYCCRKAAP